MKQTDNFVLRQVADEKILIPCGSMAEQMAQVITLSETAEYIYEQSRFHGCISDRDGKRISDG